jgi:hypothetical protein
MQSKRTCFGYCNNLFENFQNNTAKAVFFVHIKAMYLFKSGRKELKTAVMVQNMMGAVAGAAIIF